MSEAEALIAAIWTSEQGTQLCGASTLDPQKFWDRCVLL